MAMDIIEHVDNDEAVFRELARVLRPNRVRNLRRPGRHDHASPCAPPPTPRAWNPKEWDRLWSRGQGPRRRGPIRTAGDSDPSTSSDLPSFEAKKPKRRSYMPGWVSRRCVWRMMWPTFHSEVGGSG